MERVFCFFGKNGVSFNCDFLLEVIFTKKIIILSSLVSVQPSNYKTKQNNNKNVKKFKVVHKSGHSYYIYHFQNLGIYVKQSIFNWDSEFQPDINSFKPISPELFNTIKNSEVFKVIPC